MNLVRRVCVCLFVSVLATLPSIGQPKYGFHFQKNRSFSKVPFLFHSNLIIVPVLINNSDTLRFILDTGVSTIILTDPSAARKLGLKATRQVKIAGAGEGGQLLASVSLGNTLRMGDAQAFNQNIVILDQDVLAISEYVGVPIHGIFGYDIFNYFVVTIDFTAKIIILELPDKFRYHKSSGEKYPIILDDTKPFFTDLTVIEGGKSFPVKSIIDTGAGHSLSINLFANAGISPPTKLVRAQLGRGLSGVINGSLGRISQVKFGKFLLKDVVASFPDSSSYASKLSPSSPREGNIGCELLRRFRVTFNYSQRYILLKPIRRLLKEPFEHNMSGLELIAKGKDFKEFIIDRIIEDSPADFAGLAEGDQIIIINGKQARELTITEIYKFFQKGEGREITILVQRDGKLFFTNFFLKRLI